MKTMEFQSTHQNTTATSQNKKIGVPLKLLGSIFVIITGLLIYWATGLYDAAESTVLKIGLGVVITWYYLVTFHAGLMVDGDR